MLSCGIAERKQMNRVGGDERGKQGNRLNLGEQTVLLQDGDVGGRVKWARGIKEGTCDEHRYCMQMRNH